MPSYRELPDVFPPVIPNDPDNLPVYAYAEDDWVVAWSPPPYYGISSASLTGQLETEAGGVAEAWFDREAGEPTAIFRDRDRRMFEHADWVDGSRKIHAKERRAAARGVAEQDLDDADFPALARAWRDGTDVLLETFDVTEDGGAGPVDSAMVQRVLRETPGETGGLGIVRLAATIPECKLPVSGPWLRSLLGPTFHERCPRLDAQVQLWVVDTGLALAPGVHLGHMRSSDSAGYVDGSEDPKLPERLQIAFITLWFSVSKGAVTVQDLYRAGRSSDENTRQTVIPDDHPILRSLRDIGPGVAVETYYPEKPRTPPTQQQLDEAAAERAQAEREGSEYVEPDWTSPLFPARLLRLATIELNSDTTVEVGMSIKNPGSADAERHWRGACQTLVVFRR